MVRSLVVLELSSLFGFLVIIAVVVTLILILFCGLLDRAGVFTIVVGGFDETLLAFEVGDCLLCVGAEFGDCDTDGVVVDEKDGPLEEGKIGVLEDLDTGVDVPGTSAGKSVLIDEAVVLNLGLLPGDV